MVKLGVETIIIVTIIIIVLFLTQQQRLGGSFPRWRKHAVTHCLHFTDQKTGPQKFGDFRVSHTHRKWQSDLKLRSLASTTPGLNCHTKAKFSPFPPFRCHHPLEREHPENGKETLAPRIKDSDPASAGSEGHGFAAESHVRGSLRILSRMLGGHFRWGGRDPPSCQCKSPKPGATGRALFCSYYRKFSTVNEGRVFQMQVSITWLSCSLRILGAIL